MASPSCTMGQKLLTRVLGVIPGLTAAPAPGLCSEG